MTTWAFVYTTCSFYLRGTINRATNLLMVLGISKGFIGNSNGIVWHIKCFYKLDTVFVG